MSMTFSEETVKRVGHPSRWHGQRRVTPRSEAGLLSPCSFTLPLIPDTASSLLDSGPLVWCHHSEFWKHWTHSMCLSVWMCFLNHCFSSASDFLFPRKSHYDVSSPGLREKQTDPVPGKWPLPPPPAPGDPSPVSPFPALIHKGQSWILWELQVHTLNSWKGGNYE